MVIFTLQAWNSDELTPTHPDRRRQQHQAILPTFHISLWFDKKIFLLALFRFRSVLASFFESLARHLGISMRRITGFPYRAPLFPESHPDGPSR